MKKRKQAPRRPAPFVDDGHTVYDMSGLGGPAPQGKRNVPLSRAEKRAAVSAAFAVYLPALLMVLGGFGLAFAVLYFWLM